MTERGEQAPLTPRNADGSQTGMDAGSALKTRQGTEPDGTGTSGNIENPPTTLADRYAPGVENAGARADALAAFAERVERLTCPDAGVEEEIARSLGWRIEQPPRDSERPLPVVWVSPRGIERQVGMPPRWTARVDDVLVLIREYLPDAYHGYQRTALRPGMIPGSSPWPYRAEVGEWGKPSRGNGHSPALALLAAFFRALSLPTPEPSHD